MALYKGSQKVAGSAGVGFDPQNAGTTGQVLTKTTTGYNWDDATGSIESSNDTYDNIIYLTQAEYDNLSSYEPNTLYSTPDGEAGTFVDNTAYGSSWNGVTDKAPSKDAVFDIIETKASIVYLTQSQYDLLPSSKLTDGVNYVIIEGDTLMEYSDIVAMTYTEALAELNAHAEDYYSKFTTEDHLSLVQDYPELSATTACSDRALFDGKTIYFQRDGSSGDKQWYRTSGTVVACSGGGGGATDPGIK